MKIVFLNIWHCRCKEDLISFIEKQAADTSVFCFQEAGPEDRRLLQTLLPEFGEYAQDKSTITAGELSVATYVGRDVTVAGMHSLFGSTPDMGIAMVTDIRWKGRNLTLANVHGISFRGNDTKLDTEGRLLQTEQLLDACGKAEHPVVIGGDFNMLPEAQSIQAFSKFGYQDLIADHRIATTRNRLVWERFPDSIQYYADYVFANGQVQVESFTVPSIAVSDHLPLIVGFELAPELVEA